MPSESTQDQPPPGLKLRHTLRGHESMITRIAWSPDGRTLASPSCDETIRLTPTFAGAYFCRGLAWGSKREYDRAILDLDQAIRLCPDGPQREDCRSALERYLLLREEGKQ